MDFIKLPISFTGRFCHMCTTDKLVRWYSEITEVSLPTCPKHSLTKRHRAHERLTGRESRGFVFPPYTKKYLQSLDVQSLHAINI